MTNVSEIDLTGMKCPMPIVHLTKLMKTLDDGDEVTAFATDPAFCLDVEAWCKRTGHELVELVNSENRVSAKICKTETQE
ncbi:sulfur transfer protein SirA [Planctomycetes bacterium CA13]|uniref:Sulfur transfer protein SirA n=1 Tax=Novipirellula herctigrandis TaxID=2527986 RepID=A0A5C5YZG2_9BACT|nr:sulfur transfer protein SirA [Planctomycetes bacterium CA13]